MGRGWVVLGLSSLLSVGCGGDERIPRDSGPLSDGLDASPDGPMPVGCPEPDFGDLGEVYEAEGFQFPQELSDPKGPQVRQVSGLVGDGHHLMVQVWDERGTFADGPAEAGTFTLTTEKVDLEACGICLSITVGGTKDGVFMAARSGTVTLDSIDGELTGSAADVTLQNVRFGEEGGLGDCISTVASLSFAAPFMP